MSKLNNLSVCILVLNEARHIEKTLKSVHKLAAEIIVMVDDLTTDETEKIALRYTEKVYKCPHDDNFHINKQLALEKAVKPWILWLDGDEEISSELADEIKSQISSQTNKAYYIPRKNYIFKKWIHYTGWYPDHQLRLFRKGRVKFVSRRIHDHPHTDDLVSHLKNPLIHHNYQNISQFIEKLNRYTSVDAQDYVKKLKPPYYKHFITKPLDEFIKRFLAWKGYKDGLHGLALSLLQAFYELVVVAKAWEAKNFEKDRNNSNNLIIKTENEVGKILKNWHWWKCELKIKKSSNFIKKTWLKGLRKLGL